MRGPAILQGLLLPPWRACDAMGAAITLKAGFHLARFQMHFKTLVLSALILASGVCSAEGQEAQLGGGDSIVIPDEWKITKPQEGLPSQVPATILIAGSKDGCGLRIDGAGEQKQDDFKATTAQYDDYLSQLLATSGLKIKSQSASSETKVAGFRAISKDFKLEIEGGEWGARVAQFNSKNRLYSVWILSPFPLQEQKCFDSAEKVLDTFKSK